MEKEKNTMILYRKYVHPYRIDESYKDTPLCIVGFEDVTVPEEQQDSVMMQIYRKYRKGSETPSDFSKRFGIRWCERYIPVDMSRIKAS